MYSGSHVMKVFQGEGIDNLSLILFKVQQQGGSTGDLDKSSL